MQRPRAKRNFCSDPEITFAAVPLLTSSVRNSLSTRLLMTENTKWKLISDITETLYLTMFLCCFFLEATIKYALLVCDLLQKCFPSGFT